MIKIGLTGSVGMGKTTTAKVFEKFGCDVWDADKTVHKLYSKGGKAVVKVAKLFPSSLEDGSISRSRLKALLKNEPENLKELEEIVHPLILEDRKTFKSILLLMLLFLIYRYYLKLVQIKTWIKQFAYLPAPKIKWSG